MFYISGMVSQCAGCNVYEPWAAFVIGSIAGAVFIVIDLLMLKLKLDDPLDAVAVHLGKVFKKWYSYFEGV